MSHKGSSILRCFWTRHGSQKVRPSEIICWNFGKATLCWGMAIHRQQLAVEDGAQDAHGTPALQRRVAQRPPRRPEGQVPRIGTQCFPPHRSLAFKVAASLRTEDLGAEKNPCVSSALAGTHAVSLSPDAMPSPSPPPN